jgi:hypothetical protein
MSDAVGLGIDLNPAIYTTPVVIGAGVSVSNTGHPDAVYRHSGATMFFVIDNNVASDSGIGVYLAPGGSVTNAATASNHRRFIRRENLRRRRDCGQRR